MRVKMTIPLQTRVNRASLYLVLCAKALKGTL
jgi:hypothetical protein